MVITILKVIVFAAMVIGLLLQIPALFGPIGEIIDDIFNVEMMSFFNSYWTIVPDELMAIIAIVFGGFIISIIITWIMGASNK